MKYIGIDPGTNGGAAIIDYDGSNIMILDFSKATDHDIADWIQAYAGKETRALVEKVHSMPRQGVASTFKFGREYGFILGVLTALRIPIEHIQPQAWQRAMGITKKAKTETDTSYKNRLKSRAQGLFPHLTVTLKTCDALLIAEYHRRTWNL
jgi:Holliday junction resolvasome RuvABC endonuclease subunit